MTRIPQLLETFRGRPIIRGTLILSISLTLLLCASGALADDHGPKATDADSAQVKYRQKVMETIGTNMGAIGDILKFQLNMPGAIANHAGQMADAASLIAPAFKKPVRSAMTDAKDDIWEDWAKFDEAIAKYEAAARDLEKAANSGDPAAVGPAMKMLGKSCGTCHKPFRKPKEESFKNR